MHMLASSIGMNRSVHQIFSSVSMDQVGRRVFVVDAKTTRLLVQGYALFGGYGLIDHAQEVQPLLTAVPLLARP